jgi:ketosteroid isomerase-like protein
MMLPVNADAVFDDWERAWSGRDPAGFESVCHPEVRYEDPLTPEPLAGPRAIARHAAALWQAFPDARLNATGDRLTDGVHACAPCKLLGTHHGRLGRVSPTGRFIVVHAVVYAELREERLLRVRAFFDVYGAAVELGVLPRAGTAGERALLMLRGFGLRG